MSTKLGRWIASAGAAMMLASGGGCARRAGPPPPMPAPQAAVSLTHFTGTPLSGPRPAAGAVQAVPALVIEIDWFAVERMPEDELAARSLAPVGSAARLVMATGDRQPVLSTSRLTASGRWATGGDAVAFARAVREGRYGQTLALASYRAALPEGVTINARATPAGDGARAAANAPVIDVFAQHVPAVAAAAAPKALAAAAAKATTAPAPAAGAAEVSLGVQDFAVPAEEQAEPAMNQPAEPAPARRRRSRRSRPPPPSLPEAPAPRPVLTRELAIFPPPSSDGGGGKGGRASAVLVLPSPFFGSSAKAMVVTVTSSPAADDAPTQKLIADALSAVRRQGGAANSARASTRPAEWPGYESALAALDAPQSRRRAMAFLASQTGAQLCGDIALTADDATLQQLAADVRARAAAANPPYSADALGWLLDRACLEWCARLSGENRLPPELSAVLSTYAGEAGRRPASLEEVLRGTGSRATLEARLVSENMIYLEDSSPSARVRATDWLAVRGRAPAGFDPLGPPRERREAIERALDATAAAATRPSTQPTNSQAPSSQ